MNQKELDDSFFLVCAFSMVRDHTVVRTAADRHFWYEFRKAQKTPTRRLPGLAPDFPSTATLPIGPSQDLKTAWIDPPGYSPVSVKQRKWVGWKTRVDNRKSAGKRPVGFDSLPGTVEDHGKNPLRSPTFDPPQ